MSITLVNRKLAEQHEIIVTGGHQNDIFFTSNGKYRLQAYAASLRHSGRIQISLDT